MDQGSFVAPFEEFPHRLPVRSGQHVVLHRRLGGPYGAGPECAIRVAEQRYCDISLSVFCLTGRAQSIEEKWNEISRGTYTQPGDRDDCHEARIAMTSGW